MLDFYDLSWLFLKGILRSCTYAVWREHSLVFKSIIIHSLGCSRKYGRFEQPPKGDTSFRDIIYHLPNCSLHTLFSRPPLDLSKRCFIPCLSLPHAAWWGEEVEWDDIGVLEHGGTVHSPLPSLLSQTSLMFTLGYCWLLISLPCLVNLHWADLQKCSGVLLLKVEPLQGLSKLHGRDYLGISVSHKSAWTVVISKDVRMLWLISSGELILH